MSALAVGAVWAATGFFGALIDRNDRYRIWLLAGALFGPFWILVSTDRRLPPAPATHIRPGEMRSRGLLRPDAQERVAT